MNLEAQNDTRFYLWDHYVIQVWSLTQTYSFRVIVQIKTIYECIAVLVRPCRKV
jgi:hypothetical protein